MLNAFSKTFIFLLSIREYILFYSEAAILYSVSISIKSMKPAEMLFHRR